jgi:hypothetical protein
LSPTTKKMAALETTVQFVSMKIMFE